MSNYYKSRVYQETVCLVSLDGQKWPVSISLTHLSRAADRQEFGTLIKFGSLSQSSSFTKTKRHTCNRSQVPLYVVKNQIFWLVLQRWCCVRAWASSPNIHRTSLYLCQLAVQAVADLVGVHHLYSSFLLSALSSSTDTSSNVLLTVFGSSILCLFLSPGGHLFRSNHHIQQMVSILWEGLWTH